MPALAQADHGPPVGGPEVERYLQIASAHWSAQAPTCTLPDGQVLPVHAALYDDPNPAVSARAEMPGCRIWLDRDFWPRRPDEIDCTIVVHEWGHLLGYGHSSEQDSLMYEQPTQGAPGCALLQANSVRPAQEGKPGAVRRRAKPSPHLKHVARKRDASPSPRPAPGAAPGEAPLCSQAAPGRRLAPGARPQAGALRQPSYPPPQVTPTAFPGPT